MDVVVAVVDAIVVEVETGVAEDEVTSCLTELFPLTAKLAKAVLSKLLPTEPDVEATDTEFVFEAEMITFGSTTETEAGECSDD